jgi:hypothetical protein
MPWPPMANSGGPNPNSGVIGELLLAGLRDRVGTVLMAVEMLFAGSSRACSCNRQGCQQKSGQGSDAFHRH